MDIREEVISFGSGASLTGILARPAGGIGFGQGRRPAVLLLGAGLTHRVGPHRLYVRLARTLAGLGFVSFRFDFSGVGDSGPRLDSIPFYQSSILEVRDAMGVVSSIAEVDGFVLAGLCSGAAVAFRLAGSAAEVRGAVLMNPVGHLHAGDEKAASDLRREVMRRHYLRLLFASSLRRKVWRRLLLGQISLGPVLGNLSGALRVLGRQRTAMASSRRLAWSRMRELEEQGLPLLHVYSEGDKAIDYLYAMLGRSVRRWMKKCRGSRFEFVKGANHTFSLLWSQEYVTGIVANWIASEFAGEQHPE